MPDRAIKIILPTDQAKITLALSRIAYCTRFRIIEY